MRWASTSLRNCASAARTSTLVPRSLHSTVQRTALITRPEPEASQWVEALLAQGLQAQAFPLICIGSAPDEPRLQWARESLAGYHAVMFVSGNAARHFFGTNSALGLVQKAQVAINSVVPTRMWSPGPGTARTLKALGVAADRIDQPAVDAAQFDSESLWQQVSGHVRPGDRVLIVRGSEAGTDTEPCEGSGTGREWLSEQIRQAGGHVDYVAAYTRSAPVFTSEALAGARAAADDASPWVLSSVQGLGYLTSAVPGQSWSRACAVATHPRIAEAARDAGFGSVNECRPALADVAAALKRLC